MLCPKKMWQLPSVRQMLLEYIMISGQFIATSHEFSPQMDPNGGLVREIPPYFRKISVGEILFHLAR